MSNDDPAALEIAAKDDASIDQSDREVRALTQYLTVLDDYDRARGADGLYMVVSQNGEEYLVDTRLGACECSDSQYRDVQCKHQYRVAFATGERPLPAWIDANAIDAQLGEHVSGPRQAATDGGVIVAGDEGEILDENVDDDDVEFDVHPRDEPRDVVVEFDVLEASVCCNDLLAECCLLIGILRAERVRIGFVGSTPATDLHPAVHLGDAFEIDHETESVEQLWPQVAPFGIHRPSRTQNAVGHRRHRKTGLLWGIRSLVHAKREGSRRLENRIGRGCQ